MSLEASDTSLWQLFLGCPSQSIIRIQTGIPLSPESVSHDLDFEGKFQLLYEHFLAIGILLFLVYITADMSSVCYS